MICDECKEKKYYFGDLDILDYCELCQKALKCIVCSKGGDLIYVNDLFTHEGICRANLEVYPDRYIK